MGAEPGLPCSRWRYRTPFRSPRSTKWSTGSCSLAALHRVTLIGGNITRSPGPLVVDVTAIGSVRPRRILTRSGARPGDAIYVTGTVGDAAIGLRKLLAALDSRESSGTETVEVGSADDDTDAVQRYLRPEPRVRAGLLIGRNRAASSCMDLSDGLADAVHQIAQASNVGMVLDSTKLPISAAVRRWHEQIGGDPVATALAGETTTSFCSRSGLRNRPGSTGYASRSEICR